MSPTWTVLIPTLGQRSQLLRRLLDVLLPQLEPYGDRARVLALWNNADVALTSIRQTLVESVTTDYLCFIDDDDLVPEHYARDIMRALEYDVDYVGWIVECAHTERQSQLAYHSLRYGDWYQRDQKLYRDISHVNPIRTGIAQRVDFRLARRFQAEDRLWASQLRRLKALRREVYIDQVMYHYLYSPASSDTWRNPRKIQRSSKFTPLAIDHPNFSWYTGEVLSDTPGSSRSRVIGSRVSNTRV